MGLKKFISGLFGKIFRKKNKLPKSFALLPTKEFTDKYGVKVPAVEYVYEGKVVVIDRRVEAEEKVFEEPFVPQGISGHIPDILEKFNPHKFARRKPKRVNVVGLFSPNKNIVSPFSKVVVKQKFDTTPNPHKFWRRFKRNGKVYYKKNYREAI